MSWYFAVLGALVGLFFSPATAYAGDDLLSCARRLEHGGSELRPLTRQDIDKVAQDLAEPTPAVAWRAIFAQHHLGAVILDDDNVVGVAVAERIGKAIHIRRLQTSPKFKHPSDLLHGLIAQVEDSLESGDVMAVTVSEFARHAIDVLESRGYEKASVTQSGLGEMWVFTKKGEGESFWEEPKAEAPQYFAGQTVKGDYDPIRLSGQQMQAAFDLMTDYERNAKIPDPFNPDDFTILVRIGSSHIFPKPAALISYENRPGEYRIRTLWGQPAEREILFQNLVRRTLNEGKKRVSAYYAPDDVEMIAYLESKGFAHGGIGEPMVLELGNPND